MKQTIRALLLTVAFTVLLGLIYPLAVTGVSQLIFPEQANGSVVKAGGIIIGSALIGQQFTDVSYFHGRPSAVQYDAGNSGGFNYGPMNDMLRDQVTDRVAIIRRENALASNAAVSADLVLASASGLDPHISTASAYLQAARIAASRTMHPTRRAAASMPISAETVRHIIDSNAVHRYIFFGEKYVNVLELNCALDRISSRTRMTDGAR